MNTNTLIQNMKRIRGMRQFSQQKLADASGLSIASIKNYESGKTTPKVSALSAIAKAMGVGLEELLSPVQTLRSVRFRASKKMRTRADILADTSRWLHDFNELEEALGEHPDFKLNSLIGSKLRPIELAKSCRDTLELGLHEPIYDICGLFEDAGVKIFSKPVASDGFFGLAVGQQDGGPAIVVNTQEQIAVERRIFTPAHELGHLLMHLDAFDACKEEEDKEEESEANSFAGHFIMPNTGFHKEWNASAGLHPVDRVLKVKRIFRVSYKTILWRLKELGLADDSIWKNFNIAYKKKYNQSLAGHKEPFAIIPKRSDEPQSLSLLDFTENRLSLLVRRAIEQEDISLSRGAEILRISVMEMRQRLVDWGDVA